MKNELIVVSVTPFSGSTTPDKNGKHSVMLQLIAGRMPNRNVISGTVAERAGIEVGKTYLMLVREQGIDEKFGADFNFIKIKELETGEDIIEAARDLGDPEIVTITRPAGFEEHYKRKGNAVESARTERIREGKYQPSYNTTVTHHETASEVLHGSIQEGVLSKETKEEVHS